MPCKPGRAAGGGCANFFVCGIFAT